MAMGQPFSKPYCQQLYREGFNNKVGAFTQYCQGNKNIFTNSGDHDNG
jgi:hypothetical protein